MYKESDAKGVPDRINQQRGIKNEQSSKDSLYCFSNTAETRFRRESCHCDSTLAPGSRLLTYWSDAAQENV